MDTHKKIREHISALSDGALPSSDLELAFAALQGADGQHAWNTYFRIGDELRAQATPALSDGFAERLAERLAAEPAHTKRAAASASATASASGAPVAAAAAAPARAADASGADQPVKPAIINAS